MSKSPSPTPPKGSVRNIISIFENQSYTVDSEPTKLIRRTKSLGSLTQRPQVIIKKSIERIEPEQNLELAQIEQQIRHLQSNLSNKYRSYSRENHIYYQNQIIFILTDLANLDSDEIDAKLELTEFLKRLNKKLNALLPSSGGVVSTTKTKKKEKVEVRSERVKVEEKVKEVAPPPREEVFEEKEDEIDAPAVSVRTLKEIFEKNTNENEAKREFGTKVTRKFLTFNGTSDLKYVSYEQKYKPRSDFDEAVENSFSSRAVSSFDEENYEDKDGNLSPDSLSQDSSNSGGSDDERSEEDGDDFKERN